MRKPLILVMIVATLLLSGCGDNSADDDQKARPKFGPTVVEKTPEAAKAVVEEFVAAFADGDAEAGCELLTPEYQQQTITDVEEFSDAAPENCAEAFMIGIAMATAFGLDPSTIVVLDATVDGNTATVPTETGSEGFDSTTYTLNWVDGEWLIAAG